MDRNPPWYKILFGVILAVLIAITTLILATISKLLPIKTLGKQDKNYARIELKASGVPSADYERVEKALYKLGGVIAVGANGSPKNKTLDRWWVEFNPQHTTTKKIVQCFKKLGFTAKAGSVRQPRCLLGISSV